MKKDTMTIYKLLLKHMILPIGNVFYGGHYLKFLKQWRVYDSMSEEDLKGIQEKNLRDILNHATQTVPYYKSLSYSSLADFPILTKDILRSHKNDLVSSDFNITSLDKHHSSGSTGVQSFTYMTKEHTFYLRALQTHWWQWSGYDFGDYLLQFGISQKRSLLKKLKDFFYRCYYNKAFGVSETDLKHILKNISKKKGVYIAGYPSVINQLALTKNHLKSKPHVLGIVCFGDKLFHHYTTNIKQAFGNSTTIVDTYGCAEGLLMACKYDLEYYYIMSPHVVLEIVDDNGNPVKDGDMGHVLVTCLTNKAMPLIRYKLGDLAIKLPKEHYPKHRKLNYPLLQKVVGRETDIIKTTKNITLNVHSFTGVLEYYQEIKQYKVIQNNLESITIQYIAEPNFKDTCLEEIKTKLNTLTQQCLNIYFEKVPYIAPTKSGKPQIIESNL
ncbi:AMP-binding protein [Mangrovimonas spongiae]|uniref:Phenylacetate--CoA ligase family protein n=1 Tax=Mangrovimonas spongiae TaxID=2494697 RepID=A0A3R9MIZ2_9FLAO|nr:AMP-binding protein [Mangrovimonas spongiae]RSK41499.1 phenylacetate--CoA ligase family protein [Mangrovimonas spongiae]